MKKSSYIAISITIATFAVLSIASYKLFSFFYAYPDKSAVKNDDTEISIVVPAGASFNKIINILHENGIITKPLVFRLYTMMKTGDIKVQKGPYKFRRSMTPKEVIKVLKAGPKITLISVTVPEGKNILEVSRILEKAGLGKYDDFMKLIRSPDFVSKLGAKGQNLEGYLMPETYRFREGSSPEEVLTHMVKLQFRVWNSLKKKHQKEFRKLQSQLKWNSHDMLIMASLVEKETGIKKERPLIAGVFLNRLLFEGFKPKFLQTDPTIIYGCTVPLEKSEACKKFTGRIRTMHLRDKDNVYNTYTHTGLPPGPICSPGKAAMESVLKPEVSRYLYFVAKTPGGEHYFSETVNEHEKAVDRYIRKKGI